MIDIILFSIVIIQFIFVSYLTIERDGLVWYLKTLSGATVAVGILFWFFLYVGVF